MNDQLNKPEFTNLKDSQRVLLVYPCTHRTERVKSPGLLLLGRARKLPSTPLVNRRFSASTPVMFGWNHLCNNKKDKRYKIVVSGNIRRRMSDTL